MAELLDFKPRAPRTETGPDQEAGLAHGPHNSGKARCLACKHEWVAVGPVGVLFFECPACSVMKGTFIFHCEREESAWTCNCGNVLFMVHREGVMCVNCGAWQQGF